MQPTFLKIPYDPSEQFAKETRYMLLDEMNKTQRNKRNSR